LALLQHLLHATARDHLRERSMAEVTMDWSGVSH